MGEVPEMVERVARAICKAKCDGEDVHPCDLANGRCKPGRCRFWMLQVDSARAAIGAMRVPPDSMCVPGGIAIEEAMFAENKLVFDGARDCFNAMIKAALASQGNGRER